MTSPTNWTRPRSVAGSIATTLASALDRRLGDVGVDAVGGAVQADGEGDRLALVEQQRRHGGAGSQLVAAVDTAARLDRIAELAEPVDVTAQGAM